MMRGQRDENLGDLVPFCMLAKNRNNAVRIFWNCQTLGGMMRQRLVA